ncbi:MAG: metallophosphoesterase [Burkholderiales bacterium]|jgi:hypothetical protein|nr:metallophosphoesterase [Burkholderiales bacterium]
MDNQETYQEPQDTKEDTKSLISFEESAKLNDDARLNLTKEDGKCHPEKQIPAVLLFPSLGTPLLWDGKGKVIRIYVVMDACANDSFHRRSMTELEHRVSVSSELRKAYSRSKWYHGKRDDVWYCPLGYLWVSQHLRFVPMDAGTNKGMSEVIGWEQGRLNETDKYASEGMKHIRVWRIGKFRPGNLRNKEGKIVGTLDTRTVENYKRLAGEFGFTLSDVFEIEIEASFLGVNDKAQTLAWLFSPSEALKFKKGDNDAKEVYPPWLRETRFKSIELQDLMLNHALMKQMEDDEKAYFKRIGEAEEGMNFPSAQNMKVTNVLLSWHPVIRNTKSVLTMGQVSDIHLNSRHYTLARSDAAIIEGAKASEVSPTGALPPAQKLCNAYVALRDIVDQLCNKADVIFFTGDYHDNNRSLDPAKAESNVESIWSMCNIFNNFYKKDVFVRGLDHMLFYTTVLDAYRTSNKPCFVLIGNHEPYRMQYGVSPRAELGKSWSFWMGFVEKFHLLSDDLHQRAKFNWGIYNKKNAGKASKWHERKGDEGIPGDHNLTPYELFLTYGPTYSQVVTAFNFHKEWFDWIAYLITPWQNWYFEHNGSPFVGLGWGDDETYVALSNLLTKTSRQQQGEAFLSRAGDAINDEQKEIIIQGLNNKDRQYYLFTHFTFISYNNSEEGYFLPPQNYSNPDQTVNQLTFCPIYESPGFLPYWGINNVEEAGWNQANWGTCEKNLPWFFENCVGYDGKEMKDGSIGAAKQPEKWITTVFSGHSHRAGVYSLKQVDRTLQKTVWTISDELPSAPPDKEPLFVKVADACDPLVMPTPIAKENKSDVTQFVVCSSSGIMGKQNFWGELLGWTYLKPSGLLYEDGLVTKVETKGHMPRLCVAAEYLFFVNENGHPEKHIHPIVFEDVIQNPTKSGLLGLAGGSDDEVTIKVTIHSVLAALDCVANIKLLKFDGSAWSVVAACNMAGKDGPIDAASKKLKRPFIPKVYDLTLPYSAFADVGAEVAPKAEGKKKDASDNEDLGGSESEKSEEEAAKAIAWFCEISFHAPQGYGGKLEGIFDVSDAWVFPLEVTLAGASPEGMKAFTIKRPKTEFGEVPNWEWLNKLNKGKYPPSRDIIFPKK